MNLVISERRSGHGIYQKTLSGHVNSCEMKQASQSEEISANTFLSTKDRISHTSRTRSEKYLVFISNLKSSEGMEEVTFFYESLTDNALLHVGGFNEKIHSYDLRNPKKIFKASDLQNGGI